VHCKEQHNNYYNYLYSQLNLGYEKERMSYHICMHKFYTIYRCGADGDKEFKYQIDRFVKAV
jgi:hypothetical protein